MVINRVKPLNPNADIYYDRTLSYVEIKVREYDLNEFNDNRKAIADEIVFLLTNGTQPPKITDNKQYTNMSKQVIRLTEGDLHNIIKESVNEILDDPYDYAKVNGLSAAAFKAARTPNADPKWAERKMRQSNVIKDRSEKLRSEFSKMNGNNPYVDFAMSGVDVHRIKQGLHDPKGYIRRNGYGNYLKGVTESDLHRIVKESVDRILKEYTGDFGYTDDNAISNRPAIGTPEYYRRSDRMQIGQEPIYNNARNWDDPNYNRKQSISIGDSKPLNTNRGGQAPNNYVEESTVNEVKYNGVSYHGTNPYDWVDVAQERQYKARGEEDKVSQYNRERFKAKDNGDFIGAENASNNADTHRQQWRIQNKKMNRNYDNAKQLGWKGVDWEGNGDTRLGKAQEYYNMSQNAQTPQDRQRYNKMAQDTLGDVEGRAQKSLNMLRAARGQA